MEGARDGWHEDRSEGQEEQGGRWREEGDRPRYEEPVARSQGCDTEGQGFGSREGWQGHPQDHEITPRRCTRAPHTRDPSWVHLQLQRLPEEERAPWVSLSRSSPSSASWLSCCGLCGAHNARA